MVWGATDVTKYVAAFLSQTWVWVGALALAAFLVLFWTLRGAPIGQGVTGEGEEAPRGGYRDRVIASVVFGLILVLAGAYVAMSGHLLWSLPVFALGFGIVLTLVAFNRKYRHGSPALRRTIEMSDAALTAALIAGILIVVNVLAFRYGGRALDFTSERAFSLSSLTTNQVKSLDRPVTFTIFFGRSPRALQQLVRVQQLLELYKAANPQKITIESVNPFTEVEKFQALNKQVPDVGVVINQQGGGVLIEYGTGGPGAPERIVLRSDDLFEMPQGRRNEPTDRFESRFVGEDAITSALMRLREGKKPRVAFTTNHGETPASAPDPRMPANGLWRSRLAAVGSEVVEIDLSQQNLSKEIALVIVDAPKTPFPPAELAKLKSYLDVGGPVVFLLGSGDARRGLEDVLRSYNVELGEGMVVDPEVSRAFRLTPDFLVVETSPRIRHPIVDPLGQRRLLMPYAAPLKVRTPGPGGQGANPSIVAREILRTRSQAWAETDQESVRLRRPVFDRGKDEQRPGGIAVGLAVSDREKPGETKEERPRLVVFGSGSMGDDSVINAASTNEDLLMNAVSWLRGRPEMQGIAPKTHVALTLAASPQLRVQLILVPTVMAVLLILGFGVSTYVARRE
jgi:ABC-type uncharacterized transport system involved in gliding motility auxiliary subunit